MPSGFIDDGYTLKAEIPAKDGKYDAVQISYRPLIRREQWTYYDQIDPHTDKDKPNDASPDAVHSTRETWDRLIRYDEITAVMLADHLVSWSIKGTNGSLADITPENVLRLHTELFASILKVILESTDEDDDAVKN